MNKSKKILLVGPELSLRGGVAHHIKTLLSSPLNNDYKLHYFRVGPKQNDSHLTAIIKFLMAPVRFLWRIWMIWPDVIHFNPSFDRKSLHRELNLVLICRLYHRPNLVQFHGGNLGHLMRNRHLPLYIKAILKLASHIVVLTTVQKKPLLKYCPETKISVIPNMIDTKRYPRNRNPVNTGHRILYMSKIESQKGAFDVLETIQYVAKEFPDIKYYFAGDGPEREKLSILCCENNYEEFVKILGYVEEQTKINFLTGGDLFLFPSHYHEGMPYALLEAMASGLPVIATRMGGITDMIADNVNGYLIPPGQPEKLAQAIIKLLSNHKRRKEFGQVNRYKSETEYDIKIICEKFSRVYEQLSETNFIKKKD